MLRRINEWELLSFAIEPKTASELLEFCRKWGVYQKTPEDVAVNLFKKRYLQPLIDKGLLFEYKPEDKGFEKIRAFLVIKRKQEKKKVPRKLLSIYQSNILFPLLLSEKLTINEIKEMNFDVSVIFWKIFAQKRNPLRFCWEILNIILCYYENPDNVRFLLYNALPDEKAEIVEKFLFMCKKIPKLLDLPFKGNLERVQGMLEEL